MIQLLLMTTLGLGVSAGPVLAGSGSTEWLSIVGKKLENGDLTVVLKSNGKVKGSGIEGVWEERDGKYCRTLTKPKKFAGTECQTVTLKGNEVTFVNPNGRKSTWTVK